MEHAKQKLGANKEFERLKRKAYGDSHLLGELLILSAIVPDDTAIPRNEERRDIEAIRHITFQVMIREGKIPAKSKTEILMESDRGMKDGMSLALIRTQGFGEKDES